jgi:deoxyribonuclease V
VQPIYVSPGHLIDLAGAIDLTLRCDGGYRQPEPTRRAHLLVNALRRGERAPTSERDDAPTRAETKGQGSFDF